MCEQKPYRYPVLFSGQRKSSPVKCVHSPKLPYLRRLKRVVSIQVYSFEVLIVPRTRSKEPKILTQNVFLVPSQTILEVNKILVQFHCLSLYPRNDFVSKRYIMIFSPRTVAFPVASSLPKKFSAEHL